jgi:hypothetical protein
MRVCARVCACGSKSAHELALVCVQGGSTRDGALPSAATCSFEMHIPVYSSKAVMLRHLLKAIETEDFGTS